MSDERFLLIKYWSHSLWSDINQVLCQLLLAELTDRKPVVYWPACCPVNEMVGINGFDLYFEPVSNASILDLSEPGHTFWPPVWNCDNLLVEDRTGEARKYGNIGEFMSSKARVVVCCAGFDIHQMIPLIRKNHPAYAMKADQIYRYLFKKYIRIKPDIEAEAQNFWDTRLENEHPVLAVHVRKTDRSWKIHDMTSPRRHRIQPLSLAALGKKFRKALSRIAPDDRGGIILRSNDAYHGEIRRIIQKYNTRKIFLLTDCRKTMEEYGRLYGSKLVLADCRRFFEGAPSDLDNPMTNRRTGVEVVRDALIASQCDFFIGNDFSGLSRAVRYMKDWHDDRVTLLYRLLDKRKYPVNTEIRLKKENRLAKSAENLKTRLNKWVSDHRQKWR